MAWWAYVLFCLAAPVPAYVGGRAIGRLGGSVWVRETGLVTWCILWSLTYFVVWSWSAWRWLRDGFWDTHACPEGELCIDQFLQQLAVLAVLSLLGLFCAAAAMRAAYEGFRAVRREADPE